MEGSLDWKRRFNKWNLCFWQGFKRLHSANRERLSFQKGYSNNKYKTWKKYRKHWKRDLWTTDNAKNIRANKGYASW